MHQPQSPPQPPTLLVHPDTLSHHNSKSVQDLLCLNFLIPAYIVQTFFEHCRIRTHCPVYWQVVHLLAPDLQMSAPRKVSSISFLLSWFFWRTHLFYFLEHIDMQGTLFFWRSRKTQPCKNPEINWTNSSSCSEDKCTVVCLMDQLTRDIQNTDKMYRTETYHLSIHEACHAPWSVSWHPPHHTTDSATKNNTRVMV